jgi:hypothetical protein
VHRSMGCVWHEVCLERVAFAIDILLLPQNIS